jgi:oligogalacturonide lyase
MNINISRIFHNFTKEYFIIYLTGNQMKINFFYVVIICFSIFYSSKSFCQYRNKSSQIPYEWIDDPTGHKVIRLTPQEGENTSFYFHNNPFLKSADGESDIMVFYGTTKLGKQLFTVNLTTREVNQITNSSLSIKGEIVASKNREVIYQCGDSVFATNVDTHITHLLYVFQNGIKGTVTSINADETLLAGTYSDGDKENEIIKQYPLKKDFFNRIYFAHIPHYLFTINIDTKELKVIHKENEWTNHVQFSPTDPNMLMYCHEGPWEKVDRIWIINVKTGISKLMHNRSVENEIAGHEFWSPDGKTIWFDLQIPKSVTFYLAGVNIETGKETRYTLQRNEWSIHFNISPDQKSFCGDGSDSAHVSKAKDGSWIYLFYPEGDKLKSIRLVNMKNHKYHLEPNVHFSPDGKWIIFRSNMYGLTNVFGMEVR